jgi:NAD(P)-dependent dehydrogenase (short-subunit alcohol dehydrogenase family)
MNVGAIVWRQNTSSAELLYSKIFGNVEFETRKDRSTLRKVCEQCRGMDVYYFTQGNIVNVSSVNGIRSFAGVLAYNISKAALDQLTRFQQLKISLFVSSYCSFLPSFGRRSI